MIFYLQIFIIVSLPYIFCSTLAALFIWERDYKQHINRLLVFTLLSAIAQTATYVIHNESLRFPLEVISGFILAYLVFRQSLKWTFKIYASSYFIGIVMVIAAILFAEILGYSFVSVYDDISYTVKFVLPMYFAVLGAAYILRSDKIYLRSFIYTLREKSVALWPILIAFFIQLVVLTSVTGQILMYNPELESARIWIWFLTMALFGISVFIVIRYIRSSRQQAVISTQESLAENIKEMVEAVRGQRHDFLNHLQVINALYTRGEMESLGSYLETLLQDTSHYNEVLKINNPVLSALINAKMTQAEERGISINVDIQTAFDGLEHAAIDLARILGNLLDNAMDAVRPLESDKTVDLKFHREGPLLVASVSNPLVGNIENVKEAISRGISTKGDGHQGLGLAICQRLAMKLHGSLGFSYQGDSAITASLVIPTSRHSAPLTAILAD